jgi:hypothetical protein
MKVESIIITKIKDIKKYEVRIVDEYEEVVSVTLPVFTTLGMNGKMNRSVQKKISTATRKKKESVIVEITKAEAKCIFDENIKKRIEKQSDAVTVVRLL